MYQTRIENTPIREQTIALLARDYQNSKETYESLLKKREEAQQAENLERRQKGEQFKVIDPAIIPEKPFKPNIQRILLFGLLLGMGSGFGVAFFREQMDRSFRDAEDLEVAFESKVLASIPRVLDTTPQPPVSGSSINNRHRLDVQKKPKGLVLPMMILSLFFILGISFIFWQEYLPITEWGQAIGRMIENFNLQVW